MNHLFIIFSENGKLHTHCEKLINSTQYRNILEEVRMCFLNGKQSHSPVSGDDSLEESGILLVYDAYDDPAYDKERLASALQKISTKYKHLYVCYHARSAEGWEDKISELDLKWAKRAITKSHTEEPYSFLHEFHSGLKTIEDLIAFWHREEERLSNENKCAFRNNLCWAIGEARYQANECNNTNQLDGDSVKELIKKCVLSELETQVFFQLKKLVKNKANNVTFEKKYKEFKSLILSKCQ